MVAELKTLGSGASLAQRKERVSPFGLVILVDESNL